MTKYITAFLLDRIAGTDEARVRMRVKWDGCRKSVAVSLGYRVNVARWDFDKQRCMPRSFHGRSRVAAAVINAEIDKYQDAADNVMTRFDAPEYEQVREALLERLKPEKVSDEGLKNNVMLAFLHFMNERGERNRWTDATYRKMTNVRRHLQEWRADLTWSDFDEDGLYSYISFLRACTRMDNRSKQSGLRDSTVEKQVGFLKWFLAWADHKGLLKCRDYLTFKPKLQKADKPVVFLTWEELMRVYEVELPEGLRSVRDIFCFCAFTSLRYSDVQSLRWADVDDDCIRVTTVKTSDALVIELNDYSQELLGRYVDEAYPDDKVFPVPANQTMNEKLKEVCKLCGLNDTIRITEFRNGRRVDRLCPKWSLIGTHAARRTFICNALTLGIAPNVVMRWTGHADYDSMKPYIAIADKVKAKEMSKFNKKLDH